MMSIKLNILFYFLLLDCLLAEDSPPSSVLQSEFTHIGHVAAFGDINNDEHTDIFVISGNSNVSVLLGGSEKQPTIRFLQSFQSLIESPIKSVIPADYNQDGFMDVVLTHEEDSKVKLEVFWGVKGGIDPHNAFVFEDEPLNDQPLLLDANGDMIADLLVSYPNNTRAFWFGHSQRSVNWTFHACDFITVGEHSLKDMRVPHSNAFIDMTGEGAADLFVTSTDDHNPQFEIWQGGKKGLQLVTEYAANATWEEVGQSVFADVDGDGKQDHLVPVCTIKDGRCTQSKIFVYKNELWIEVFQANDGWNFVSKQASDQGQPITLVVGDYNQDVFIDVLCVMERTIGNQIKKPKAVLLYGGQCSKSSCQSAHSVFHMAFDVDSTEGAFSAAFYDLEADGTLDLLVSISLDGATRIQAYRNKVVDDVSFLVVKVLPGMNKTSSSNTAGSCISYVTTNTKGGTQQASVCQLSQSAYLSLQLPYMSFGLGRLPNFVDSLKATIPSPLLPCGVKGDSGFNTLTPLSHTWTMLIPNSQLFIKPYPIKRPESWTNRLLVTPSQNVITTGIVLLSTCGLVIVMITILHCLERQEDKREKIQDAHRFHFDAM